MNVSNKTHTFPTIPGDASLEGDSGLVERLGTLDGRRVLVVGDLMLDAYIYGDVRRISPSAPVPVVLQRRTTTMLGGAANVARNLSAVGGKVDLVGVIGRDEAGGTITSLLKSMKINHRGIVSDEMRPTIVKTSIWAHGQQLLRLDVEEPGNPPTGLQDRLVAAIGELGERAEAIVLSDYAKGVLTPRVIQAAAAIAHERSIPLIVDPKYSDFRRYRGADYLTPNLKEASDAAGKSLAGDAMIETEGRKLIRRYQGKGLLITRSGEGFSLLTGRKHIHHPSQAREVFDETGCGDTFIALFSLALAAGWDAESAAILANTGAAITIAKAGSAVVSQEELSAALGGTATLGKVRSADGLALLVEHLRDRGRKVVFTNGCFDLIHVGHIRHLQEARRLGDVLIVALNTDHSVRRIKGAPRPVLAAHERASVLAALDFVDYITYFDEDSPETLLRQLRPDILVKGSQGEARPVGAEIVEQYGGKVVELPIYGSSTTDGLLEKIRGNDKR